MYQLPSHKYTSRNFTYTLMWCIFCRNKHSLKRRLRIRTLQFGTARNINELYDSVDPEAVLSILVHKVHFLFSACSCILITWLLYFWLILHHSSDDDLLDFAAVMCIMIGCPVVLNTVVGTLRTNDVFRPRWSYGSAALMRFCIRKTEHRPHAHTRL